MAGNTISITDNVQTPIDDVEDGDVLYGLRGKASKRLRANTFPPGDGTVSLAKIAPGTSGTVLGYGGDGAPVEKSVGDTSNPESIATIASIDTQVDVRLATDIDVMTSETDVTSPAFIRDFTAKRSRHDVRDYDDIDLTGENDSTSDMQWAVTTASDGYPLRHMVGEIVVEEPLEAGESFALIGLRAPANYDPEGAGWIHFAHTGKGLINTSLASSSTVQRIGFRRTQPAVVTGEAWAPNACDWDIYIDGQDVTVSENMFLNSTKAVTLAALGRLTARDNKSHAFQQALEIRAAYDRVVVDTWHQFPFWSQSAEVRAYTEANLKTYRSLRNDIPSMSNLFSIWHKRGISFGYFAGGGPSLPAGCTSKAHMPGCCMDSGVTAIYVEADANGVSAHFSGFASQGADTPVNVAAVEIAGTNSILNFWSPRFERAGAELVKLSGTGNIIRITDPSTGFYGLHASAGSAAGFDAGSSTNRILVQGRQLQDETVTFAGDVRWDHGPLQQYAGSTLTNTTGTYGTHTIQTFYRKGFSRAKFDLTIGITAVGSASGYTQATLPFNSPAFAIGTWVNVTTGTMGNVIVAPDTNVVTFHGPANEATAFASGHVVIASIEFEISE